MSPREPRLQVVRANAPMTLAMLRALHAQAVKSGATPTEPPQVQIGCSSCGSDLLHATVLLGEGLMVLSCPCGAGIPVRIAEGVAVDS